MRDVTLVLLFFFLLLLRGGVAEVPEDEEDDAFTELLLVYDFSTCPAGRGRRLQLIEEVEIRNSLLQNNLNDIVNAATSQKVGTIEESKSGYTFVKTDGTATNVTFTYLPHLQMEVIEVDEVLDDGEVEGFINFAETLDCVEKATVNALTQPAGDTRKPEFFRFTGHKEDSEILYKYPNDHLADGHQWWYSSVLNMMKYSPSEAKATINPRFQDLHQIWHGGKSGYPIILTDPGVSKRHPDLEGKRWFNEAENGADRHTETGQCKNRLDDDDNGYIDDCYGPRDRRGRRPRPTSHATGVAGLICAKTNNGLLMASACPGCSYVAGVRRMSIFRAIDYAIAIKSKIINFSRIIENYMHPIFWYFLRRALRAYSELVDGMIVVAAGNIPIDLAECTDQPFFTFPIGAPCMISGQRMCSLTQTMNNVICVGASDIYGKPWQYSSYGSMVTAFAPGVRLETIAKRASTQTASGSSFATALMSGVLGLIYSKFPDLTSEQIRRIIRVSCRPAQGSPIEMSECGGIIDAVYAFGNAAICHADPDSCGREEHNLSGAHMKDWFCSAARRYGGLLADLCP